MFHVYNYLLTTLKTNCYCMLQEYISWSILYCIYVYLRMPNEDQADMDQGQPHTDSEIGQFRWVFL